MTTLADVLIDGLAVHRVTRLVVDDTIFDAPRTWLLGRVPPKIAEGLGCYWCVSVWVAAGSVALPGVWRKARGPLAAATVTGLLAENL